MLMRFLSFFFSVCCFLASEASARPNVIVIMTDDQGWGDLSIHGNTTLETPHIDRIAREGLQFSHFYLQPVCSPTRAEFLTGRYHPRSGVFSTGGGGERVDTDEETIADVFQKAGYDTGIFGKWHSGSQYPYHPLGRGFNEFYGFTSGHWGLYFDPMVEHNGAYLRGQGYLPDDLTDRAIQFIEKNAERERPFFIYLNYNTPHSPMQVPDRFWEKFESKAIQQQGSQASREIPLHTQAALAMCENIDWNVGRIYQQLEDLEIDGETLVLYMTDNGPNGHRWNGGMRGIKGSTDEGGTRSPLFVLWPGTISPGKVVDEIGGTIDLLPTLADLAEIRFKPKKPLDGVSLKPLILGNDPDWPDRKLISSWRGRVSVRNQRFRLDHEGQLYDIGQDQAQTTDLSETYPEIVNELTAFKAAWIDDVYEGQPVKAEGVTETTRPFPVGHEDFGITHLPARDAEASGSIERSNRWPNDSFFRNWISEADEITWNVEVLTPGLYATEIWYACPEEDLGSTIELAFMDSSTSAKVLEAHNPPFLGVQYTRSPLYESPVKIFRRMGLGVIRLEAGRGTLRLKATEIPKGQALEFRLLSLSRVQ